MPVDWGSWPKNCGIALYVLPVGNITDFRCKGAVKIGCTQCDLIWDTTAPRAGNLYLSECPIGLTQVADRLHPYRMADTFAEQRKEFVSARRAKFLASAAKTLSERGIHQAKMNDIAADAGIAKVVLYRYFGSKDKLVHAILEDIVDRILKADDGDHAWWTDRVRNTLETARQHKFAMILLARHTAHHPEFSLHYERLIKAISTRVDERVGTVLSGRQPLTGSTDFLSESITMFFVAAYLRWLEREQSDDDDRFFEWITNSVRAMSFYWHGEDPTATPRPYQDNS